MDPQPDLTQKDQTQIAEEKKPETKRRTYTKVILTVVGLLITMVGLMLSQVRNYHGFDIWGAMSMGVGLIILLPGLLGFLYSYVRSSYRKATNYPDSRAGKDRILAFLVVILGVVLGYCVSAWVGGEWGPYECTIIGGLVCGFITCGVVFSEISGAEQRA